MKEYINNKEGIDVGNGTKVYSVKIMCSKTNECCCMKNDGRCLLTKCKEGSYNCCYYVCDHYKLCPYYEKEVVYEKSGSIK